jgi:hypothetical protein
MNMKRIALVLLLTLASLSTAQALNFAYDPSTGVLSVDTLDFDLVALFIEGPDVSVSGCNLCDGMNLPGTDALADASVWTVGYSAGATQWIRTNPLQGRGFVGSIGDFYIDGKGVQQNWPLDFPPFLDFPAEGLGIAVYQTGLSSADFGNVTYASDDGTVVTERLCITLAGCGEIPEAQDDEYEAMLGTVLEVMAPGVLGNDFDPDGDPIFASLLNPPALGDVILNSDGSFRYTAPAVGSVPAGTIDTFTYIVEDYAIAAGDVGTVSITLTVPEPIGHVMLIGLGTLVLFHRRQRVC